MNLMPTDALHRLPESAVSEDCLLFPGEGAGAAGTQPPGPLRRGEADKH